MSQFVSNKDVSPNAAIEGTKIVPDFGAQDIFADGYIALGLAPSSVGDIRLGNNVKVAFRKSDNLDNIIGLHADASDNVNIGDGSAAVNIRASSQIILVAGATYPIIAESSVVRIGVNDIRYEAAQVSPKIWQNDDATNGITGDSLTVQAQNATGTTTTGGSLLLKSGTGTTSNGTVQIFSGSSQLVQIHQAVGTYCGFTVGGGASSGFGFYANGVSQQIFLQTAGAGGNVLFSTDTITMGFSAGAFSMSIGASNASVTIYQSAHATSARTFTVQAGNVVTGTGSNLDLKAGTGSVTAGNTTIYAGSTHWAQIIGAGAFYVYLSSTNRLSVTAAEVAVNTQTLDFSVGVASPIFKHTERSTDAAVTNMTIQAQNAWASATVNMTGGNLLLKSGTKATAGGSDGSVQIYAGASIAISFTPTTATSYSSALDGYALTKNATNGATWALLGAGAISPGADNTVLATSGGSVVWSSTPTVTDITVGASADAGALFAATKLTWGKSVAAPEILQTAKDSDAQPQNLTLTAQAPYASATGANRTAGSVVVTVAAPVGGATTEAGLIVNRASIKHAQLGPYVGAGASYSALYLGPGINPGAGNFAQLSDASSVWFNAPGAGVIWFTHANTSTWFLSSTGVLTIVEGKAANFTHTIRTSDATVGNFTIQAQSAWASAVTNPNGGHVDLKPGAKATGSGQHGTVRLYGGSGSLAWSAAEASGASYFTANGSVGIFYAPSGYIQFWGTTGPNYIDTATTSGTCAINYRGTGLGTSRVDTLTPTGAMSMMWGEAGTSVTYGQTARTTDASTAVTTLAAQGAWASATGTNRNGGNLVLTSGAKATGGSDGTIYFRLGGSNVGWLSPTDGTLYAGSGQQVMYWTTVWWSLQVPTFYWGETLTPRIEHPARTTDAACAAFTLTPQAPYASATGTNRTPGSLVVALGAPVGGATTEARLRITRGGSHSASIGPYEGAGGSYAALYLGPGLTPSTTNFAFLSDGSGTWFNTPSGAGIMQFTHGNSGTVGLYNTGTMQWVLSKTPTLNIATPTSDIATVNFTIAPQVPYASATGTNRTPGSFIVALAVPSNSGTTEANLVINRGGSFTAQIGPLSSAPTTYSALWLTPGITPSTSNYSLAHGAGTLYLNSSTNVSIIIGASATSGLSVSASYTLLYMPNIQYVEAVAAPTYTQAACTADTTPQNLTIGPQAPFATATGANRKPGSLVVALGAPTNSGTSEAGLRITRGGTLYAQISGVEGAGASYAAMYLGPSVTPAANNYTLLGTNISTWINTPDAAGTLSFCTGNTTRASLNSTTITSHVATVCFEKSVVSPTINQTTQTTDTATQDLTIQAQNAYASAVTNTKGADLLLKSGQSIAGGTVSRTRIYSGATSGSVVEIFNMYYDSPTSMATFTTVSGHIMIVPPTTSSVYIRAGSTSGSLIFDTMQATGSFTVRTGVSGQEVLKITDGYAGFRVNPLPGTTVNIKGSGDSASTYSLICQNSNSQSLFYVRDDGITYFGASISISARGNVQWDTTASELRYSVTGDYTQSFVMGASAAWRVSNSSGTSVLHVTGGGNIALFTGSGTFGGGVGVVALAAATTVPNTGSASTVLVYRDTNSLILGGGDAIYFGINGAVSGQRLHRMTATIMSFFSASPSAGADADGVIFIGDRTAVPTGSPTSGFDLWSESGAPAWKTADGYTIVMSSTVSTSATAGLYSIPDTCVEFLEINRNGNVRKIPLFSS